MIVEEKDVEITREKGHNDEMRYFAIPLALIFLASPAWAQDVKIRNKAIKEWSAALKHPDFRVRYQAVAALYEEGAEAAPLVKELIPLLKDPQPVIRRAVVQTLANFKAEAAPAVPALIAAMKDADPWVRHLAPQALAEVGEAAGEHLVKLIDDKDATIRYHVVVTMNNLQLQDKEVVKALTKAAKDANASVRTAALYALAKLDTDDPAVFALLGESLADKDKQVRLSAANLLAGKGKLGSMALADASDDARADQRALAMQALGQLGDKIEEKGVAALRKGLEDDVPRVRLAAALSVATLGKTARELGGDVTMFQSLAKLLKEKDAQMRRTAVHALGQIGSSDADEIKTVAAMLKDTDATVRSFSVQALSRYQVDLDSEEIRKDIQGHLLEALKDTDRRVQFMAAQAIAQQTLFAVEPLTKLVEEGKGTQRLWAATILGQLGPAAADAVPALQKMARDSSPDIRRVALLALAKIQMDMK